MEVYISKGNLRMDIPTFSLPSNITCPNATDLCKKYCYARKAEVSYPNVLPSRIRNCLESENDDFARVMIKWILKHKPKYFRIHESGDFYSQGYLDKWCMIAVFCKDTKFLAYTQMYDYDYTLKPDNLIIYFSIWPDSKDIPKEGLKAYVIDDGKNKIPYYDTDGFVCKKGKGTDITCDKCLYCFEGKGNVQFKLH